MTKIKLSSFSDLSFLAMLIFLAPAQKMSAQNSFPLQKAMQSCLAHPMVRPNLKALSFDHPEEVPVVLKNSYIREDIELTMFGQEAIILERPEFFFYDIENYIEVKEVLKDKDKIILTFMAGDHFIWSYSEKKEKSPNSLRPVLSEKAFQSRLS